jgi:hypothetical protein
MKGYCLLVLAVLFMAGCARRSELDEANREIGRLKAENAELQSQLAKKPQLPVTMSLRKAMLGPGLVAVFNTTVKASVPVLVTVKSAALGTLKKFELHLNSNLPTELGHAEGAAIEQGDTITLENNNYSLAAFVVNMK